MVNFISKSGVFFSGVQLNDFMNLYISCSTGPPHITGASDLAVRKVLFNLNKSYELEIARTSSRTDNYCKSKMQDPFFKAYSRVSKM